MICKLSLENEPIVFFYLAINHTQKRTMTEEETALQYQIRFFSYKVVEGLLIFFVLPNLFRCLLKALGFHLFLCALVFWLTTVGFNTTCTSKDLIINGTLYFTSHFIYYYFGLPWSFLLFVCWNIHDMGLTKKYFATYIRHIEAVQELQGLQIPQE